jgi:hypothetical protein
MRVANGDRASVMQRSGRRGGKENSVGETWGRAANADPSLGVNESGVPHLLPIKRPKGRLNHADRTKQSPIGIKLTARRGQDLFFLSLVFGSHDDPVIVLTHAAIAVGRERERMRRMFRTAIAVTFSFVLLGMCFVSQAAAQCGSCVSSKTETTQPQLWDGQAQFMDASFAQHRRESDPIVGFWKAKFVSEGSSGIPNDTLIDSPFVQWHSDGTEIMNSTRVPATGSYCMGIWRKTGKLGYELNHFGLSFDTSGTFEGPAQIRENITLDEKADQYSGTFTIDQYDTSGSLLQEVKGQVSATRITVDTTVNQVL